MTALERARRADAEWRRRYPVQAAAFDRKKAHQLAELRRRMIA